MSARIVFTALVVLVLVLGFIPACHALKIELSAANAVVSHRKLWRPASMTELTSGSFCFAASDAQCTSQACPETLLCSLDGGNTFIDAPITIPFCGQQGVRVGGQLLCPAEQLPRTQANDVSFSVNAFRADSGTVAESISAEKQFVFHHDSAVSSIEFTGSTIYVASEDQYLMVAVVVEEEDDRRVPVLFVSEDGLTWETKSKIPLEGERFYLVSNAAGVVSVFASSAEGQFTTVSSKYMGKWWSNPQLLNTTTPPFMQPLSESGVTLEYSTDNTTRTLYLAYASERQKVPARIRLAESIKSDKECATSSGYATGIIMTHDRTKELLMLHDCEQRLYASRFTVDDSDEAAKKAKEEADRKDKEAAAEEAKRKAKAKKLEQQKTERRERRRKEQEREARFRQDDAAHWKSAAIHFHEDGEWIVVRKVQKNAVDLEKKTFFPDMDL